MSRLNFVDIPDDVKIRFNGNDIVTESDGYNAWWGREYERREKRLFIKIFHLKQFHFHTNYFLMTG